MTADPLAFLHAAHARAEKVANALPRGPWAWTRYSDPHWCHTLEGPAGFSEAVLKSATPSPGASRIELHPAFDEFLPDPADVLRRIAAERKVIAEHADDGHGDCTTCSTDEGTIEVNGITYTVRGSITHPCTTVQHLAEAWGWTGET